MKNGSLEGNTVVVFEGDASRSTLNCFSDWGIIEPMSTRISFDVMEYAELVLDLKKRQKKFLLFWNLKKVRVG